VRDNLEILDKSVHRFLAGDTIRHAQNRRRMDCCDDHRGELRLYHFAAASTHAELFAEEGLGGRCA
jgi:hypothetical protein